MDTMPKDYELQIMSCIQIQNFFKKSPSRKENITRYNMNNMLRRTLKMFKWKNLPDTITQRYMEIVIQTRGMIGFIKNNDNYYALWGTLGGIPNWEYMPSQFIVSNPYLNLNANRYEIYGENKDVVVIPNDSLYQGMLPILSYHSELLTEINLTKRMVQITSRFPVVFFAPDNNTKNDIEDYIKSLEDGDIKAIFDRNLMRDVKSLPVNEGKASNLMTQILETEQYQKAALFNDVGLQLNYNMKRETITSSEAQLGEGALLPLPDDMMECRKKACKEIKELFGLEIDVEFDSAWRNLRISIEVEIDKELKDSQEKKEIEKDVQSDGQEQNDEGVHSNGQDEESNTEDSKDEGSKDTENNDDSNEDSDSDKDNKENK